MSDKKTPFYITTPIFYPSDKLHIGHAYTAVSGDAIARYKRLRGFDVRYSTGADEHGQKIERRAKEKGVTPKAFVDGIVEGFQELWHILDITFDDFIRTSEERHTKAVEAVFERFVEQGDIYLGLYEGWYCTPCETFVLERQLKGGNCPDCKRAAEKIAEEIYFFRMSAYADRLLAHYEAHPDFLQPESRKNEIVNNFIKPGLSDLAVSRTTYEWGIKVPSNPKHVIYVWIDALLNYITSLGYAEENKEEFLRRWPADIHLVGKEIVRFHAIYWPILLLALDLPLPKKVFGHGWLLAGGEKMSKSKGNVVDPKFLAERYGADALRYFLLREVPFGSDGSFSPESFVKRLNSDLANDLGNLVSRTLSLIELHFEGAVPSPSQQPSALCEELAGCAREAIGKVEASLENLEFSIALDHVWSVVRRANKFIDETKPWELSKDESLREEVGCALYHLAESIRVVSALLQPFLAKTPSQIQERLGIAPQSGLFDWDSAREFGLLPPGSRVFKGEPLFPRLKAGEEIARIAASLGSGF